MIEQDIARVACPNGLPAQEPQILIKARRKIRIDGGRELARTGTDAEPILAPLHFQVRPYLAVDHDRVAKVFRVPVRVDGGVVADLREMDRTIGIERSIRQHERNVELARGKKRCDGIVLVADDVCALEACGHIQARHSQGVVVIPERCRQLPVEIFEGGALDDVVIGETGRRAGQNRAGAPGSCVFGFPINCITVCSVLVGWPVECNARWRALNGRTDLDCVNPSGFSFQRPRR